MNTEDTVKAIGLVADEIEGRMMARTIHFPPDRCANCDLGKTLTLLRAVLATMRGL